MKTKEEIIQQLRNLEESYEENRVFLREGKGATIGGLRQIHVEQNILIAEISMLRWVLGMGINDSIPDDKDNEKIIE
jgi:tRNA C32,U32 (ribose-2'-O)-methylase TrmJ